MAGTDARLDPAGERLADPAERIERARALAWRALNRRDRTELELRGILAEKRVAPEEAEVVVGELLDGGFIDDAAFARRFAEDRRRLDAWGSERIERRLRALGRARARRCRARRAGPRRRARGGAGAAAPPLPDRPRDGA